MTTGSATASRQGHAVLAFNDCLVPSNDWSVQLGAHGQGCGSCDSPVEHTSWGSIKAMFR